MTSLLLFNTKQYNILGFVLSGFTLNCLISITSKIPMKKQVKFRGMKELTQDHMARRRQRRGDAFSVLPKGD